MPKNSKSKTTPKNKQGFRHKSWFAAVLGLIVGVFVGLLIAFAVTSDAKDYAFASSYVGLTEAEAVDTAKAEGFEHRVVERDGEDLPATMDLREDRINFSISDDKVTKAKFY